MKLVLVPLGSSLSRAFIDSTFKRAGLHLPDLSLSEAWPLPENAYVPARHRYRADSIIHWLARSAGSDKVMIGFTTFDISTAKGDIKDWGVMGLGFQPGRACVASDSRLKDKRELWKIIVHEWGHTAGLPHCIVDSCLMTDAEGRDRTSEMRSFCVDCRRILSDKGWSL